MALSEDEKIELQQLYREIIKFYIEKVREIVIASERIDPEQRLCIPAIVEIRSAFEHIMRVHGVIEGLITDDTIIGSENNLYEYCKKNIDKAHGHLYRAAYDAYDVIAMRWLDDIKTLMDNVSREALYAVVDHAYETIISPYNEALALVTRAKLKKDIGTKNSEENEFQKYETATNALKDIKDRLEQCMPELYIYDKNLKNPEKKAKLYLFIGIMVGLIGIAASVWSNEIKNFLSELFPRKQ